MTCSLMIPCAFCVDNGNGTDRSGASDKRFSFSGFGNQETGAGFKQETEHITGAGFIKLFPFHDQINKRNGTGIDKNNGDHTDTFFLLSVVGNGCRIIRNGVNYLVSRMRLFLIVNRWNEAEQDSKAYLSTV